MLRYQHKMSGSNVTRASGRSSGCRSSVVTSDLGETTRNIRSMLGLRLGLDSYLVAIAKLPGGKSDGPRNDVYDYLDVNRTESIEPDEIDAGLRALIGDASPQSQARLTSIIHLAFEAVVRSKKWKAQERYHVSTKRSSNVGRVQSLVASASSQCAFHHSRSARPWFDR